MFQSHWWDQKISHFSFLWNEKSCSQLINFFSISNQCNYAWQKRKNLGTLPPCFSGCSCQVSSFPVCTITDFRRVPCVNKIQCSGQTDLFFIFPSCFFTYFLTGNHSWGVGAFYMGVWGSVHWLISMNYISLYWGLAFQLIKLVLSGLISCFIFM